VQLVEVVQHEPASWYLLREDGHHYFDINCSQSASSFSILLQFNEDEESEYHALGRIFLDYLAAKVSYWSSRYWSRNLIGVLAEGAHEAEANWQRAHQDKG
jgi:hypothetical protein